ncbi:metallophosphoesterase family protein [Candidatus Saganbacteria bacterium]|nr:metallophosphoesterase family protein [Candidatus Saganbacteria bacterium]
MRYGIIADIHGNLEALQKVLLQVEGKVDQIICLGDIVGYGPDPNECCEILKKRKILSVAGNHEKGTLGELELAWFNKNAAEAIGWTQKELRPENLQFIKGLPMTLDFPEFQIVHGSLLNPVKEYLTKLEEALPTFELMTKPLLFVGHTHRPLELKDKGKKILNPGSIGQPRDGDPRAAYLIFDAQKGDAEWLRVDYNIEATQEKMRQAGLPVFLVERLRRGV